MAWARFVERGESASSVVESVRTTEGRQPLSLLRKGQDDYCCSARSSQSISEELVEKLLCLVVAWSEGCIQLPCPFERPRNTTFAALRSEIRSRWTCFHDFWLAALRDTMIASDGVHPKLPHESSTILASVQTASFHLGSRRTTAGLRIVDEHGLPAGELMMQDPELILELGDISGKKFEFIALSVSTSSKRVLPSDRSGDLGRGDFGSPDGPFGSNAEREAPPTPERELEHHSHVQELFEKAGGNMEESRQVHRLTFWDGEGGFLFPLPIVNVMLIERAGEKLAKRITVGWIYLKSWSKAQCRFETVYLQ